MDEETAKRIARAIWDYTDQESAVEHVDGATVVEVRDPHTAELYATIRTVDDWSRWAAKQGLGRFANLG